MTCKHRMLIFNSGGFYVVCDACGARWVAITREGNDNSLDYDRSSSNLGAGDKRVVAALLAESSGSAN